MSDQYRFEDRMADELRELNGRLSTLTNRLTLIMGGLALLAVLLPIFAPILRQLIGVPI